MLFKNKIKKTKKMPPDWLFFLTQANVICVFQNAEGMDFVFF